MRKDEPAELRAGLDSCSSLALARRLMLSILKICDDKIFEDGIILLNVSQMVEPAAND